MLQFMVCTMRFRFKRKLMTKTFQRLYVHVINVKCEGNYSIGCGYIHREREKKV